MVNLNNEQLEQNEQTSQPITRKKSKLPFIVSGLAIAIVIFMITGLVAYNSPNVKYHRLIRQGDIYLTELEYDKAIASYQAAIELKPKEPEAYKKLAEAYVLAEEYEKAVDILDTATHKMNDDEIEELYEEYYAKYITNNKVITADNNTEVDEPIKQINELITLLSKKSTTTPTPTIEPIPTEEPEEGWKDAYIQLISSLNYSEDDYGLGLLYIDNDNIPELYVHDLSNYKPYLYTYYNDTLCEIEFDPHIINFNYIPYSGLLCIGESGLTIDGYFVYDDIYKIEHGSVVKIWNCMYKSENGRTHYYSQDVEISQEEYEAYKDSMFTSYHSMGESILDDSSYRKTDLIEYLSN